MSEEKNLGDDLKEGMENAADKAKEAANNIKESWNEVRDSGDNKKVLAGILALVLGGFGVHKFILGYNQEGVILLVATLAVGFFSFGSLSGLIWVFTIVEGVIYLTKSEAEFYDTYQANKRPWL